MKKKLTIFGKKKKDNLKKITGGIFWFLIGGLLGFFFLISFVFIFFQKKYANVVYPGVTVNEINFGGKEEGYVKSFFARKNDVIANTNFVFEYQDQKITVTSLY